MRNNWFKFLVAAVVGAALIPTSAFATCLVTVTGPISFHAKGAAAATVVTDPNPLPGGTAVDGLIPNGAVTPALINAEGTTERISDVLVTDDGAGVFCFGTGNHVVLTLNSVLKSPVALTVPGNIDIYDSNGTGGLTISGATISPGFAANQAQTVIDITVQQNGTVGSTLITAGAAGGGVGAGLRLKNLRIDATGVSGTGATATVSATGQIVVGNPFAVGTKTGTITGVGAVANGTGVQSSNAKLGTDSSFSFSEGFADAFRTCGGTATTGTGCAGVPHSGVANDIATSATSLIFSVTAIPSGVTVTFPATINTSAETASATTSMIWTARSATLTNGGAPGTLSVIYDTTTNPAGGNGAVIIDTENSAAATGSGACGAPTLPTAVATRRSALGSVRFPRPVRPLCRLLSALEKALLSRETM